MPNPSSSPTPAPQKNYGMYLVIILLGIASILGVFLFFIYARSQSQLMKSFSEMQEIGKNSTIKDCIQENMRFYRSCDALQQLCDQSVSQMMRICLVNGEKNAECAQYGDEIYDYKFGAEQCKPYFSQKNLKKACADTYQTVADFCKAVRKIH